VKGGLDNVLTNMNLSEDGREVDYWGNAVMLAEQGNVIESMMVVKSVAPRQYALDYRKLKGNFNQIKEDAIKTKVNVYALNTYEVPEQVEK
jgi:hypothetical protein